MRPRVVDWTLYGLAAIAALTGFGAWLVTDQHSRAILTAHAVAGFALLVPLAWKLRRVRLRLVRLKAWDAKTPISALTTIAALAAIGSGAFWTHAQWPTGYPNGSDVPRQLTQYFREPGVVPDTSATLAESIRDPSLPPPSSG
jgi:hypothetical protein